MAILQEPAGNFLATRRLNEKISFPYSILRICLFLLSAAPGLVLAQQSAKLAFPYGPLGFTASPG